MPISMLSKETIFLSVNKNIFCIFIRFSVSRQQWNDNRLAFNSIGGKIKYLTMTERNKVIANIDFLSSNNYNPGLDARYILQKWERWKISRHYSTKLVCSSLPWWWHPLQHQVSGSEDYVDSVWIIDWILSLR